MGDFMPISCCNLVYKCITKILANRLVAGLDEVISSNQGAFVPKRSIVENILLAQELVCNYHRTVGKARCTLKIDLMKAYDSLNWDYVLHCLGCVGAPIVYVNWVKECITSPRFTLALNGTLVGYFKGRKGLRQGDPLFPYLFVIAMEGLSRLFEEAAIHNPLFDFHPKCSSLKLTHLCFADDLLIFSTAFCDSIKVINDVLEEFEELAGLKENPTKSSVFFGGVSLGIKNDIMNFLHMHERKLPIQYLGVPLLSKRLTATDCDVLVSKIASCIDSWLARNLSFAGRLQLVSSVFLSIQVYWAKVFILPKMVIFLQQKFKGFLWGGKDTKAHAKVSREKLYNPKCEGGLGIKIQEVWNNASIL
jgi:hypothetical protein